MLSRIPPTWTEERIEMLRDLWAKGLSASAIAAELGISRNSVLGKRWRLGLPSRSDDPTPEELALREERKKASKERRKTRRKLKIAAARYGAQRGRIAASLCSFTSGESKAPVTSQFQAEQIEDAGIPVAQRRSLLELGPRHCRWIIGDPREPDHFYCGGNTVYRGAPYCRGHAARAYEAPRRRNIERLSAVV